MSNSTADTAPLVVPARLSFLSIYNPELGRTDETFQNQIVFHYSRAARARRRSGSNDKPDDRSLKNEENEMLRQIGLAQGMVNFAKSFSSGQKIDNVETERARIVIHELEPDWWIIASIDLTRLPVSISVTAKSTTAERKDNEPTFEYSSREVSPPALLIEQLVQAHAIFRLHNGPSLPNLFTRLLRRRFCSRLESFWSRFCLNWDVMLHGNPATDVFGGMKLGVAGELGMGVGEEEWGSGEREVLEDFARRTDGLVEMIVSRFGDQSEQQAATSAKKVSAKTKGEGEKSGPWMGIGEHHQAHDGVIFSGIGPVSRNSLRDISFWMRWIYYHGEHAYGVKDNPSSARPKRKRHRLSERSTGIITNAADSAENSSPPSQGSTQVREETDPPLGIPRSVVSAAEKSLETATAKAGKKQHEHSKAQETKSNPTTGLDQDKWIKYLTLGYGSAWGPGDHGNTPGAGDTDASGAEPASDTLEARLESHIASETSGQFLIGLTGGLDDESDELEDSQERPEHDWNRRVLVRTLYVHEDTSTGRRGSRRLSFVSSAHSGSQHDVKETSPERNDDDYIRNMASADVESEDSKVHCVRVLVYVHRPFIYTLLFDPSTPTLSIPTFYRNLHTFLAPLQQLLVRRTGAHTAIQRKSGLGQPGDKVWDLIYDPADLTICSSIPSIPRLNSLTTSMPGQWGRSDALNVHSAMLEIVRGTRIGGEALDETERSIKTARGWWVVWMKVKDKEVVTPQSNENEETSLGLESPGDEESNVTKVHGKDVILVRRARDAQAASTKGKGRSVSSWGFGGARDSSESSGLAMGFDARKYVENLVGLGK